MKTRCHGDVGPGYGLDNYNNGAMMAHFMLLFAAVASMMGILLTLPHTREDEEDGRTEMIAPSVGSSSLTAAISVSALSQLVLMLLSDGVCIF